MTIPPAAWEPTGPRTTWRGISFIVPAGLHGTDRGEIYDMAGPGIRGGAIGQCSIVVFGDQPAGSDPVRQAHELLVAILASFGQRVTNSRGESDLTIDRRVGRSADGWSWVELSGMLGEGVGGRARIMLILRGATVVPIVAVAGQGNGCVGLARETTANDNTVTWVAFYHSLRISGSTPSTHLREQIIGRWEALSVSTGGAGASQEEAYAANGRYGSASMIGRYTSETDFLAASFSGDGRYIVEDNRLTIFPDRGPAQTTLVRIVEDREPLRPSQPAVRLCKVKVDSSGPYESCLLRSRP